MALGNGNDNGGRRNYDQNYYSRFRITNSESKLSLKFRFASGMLVMTISKLKDENGFEFEDLNEIWITPTKARILVDTLKDPSSLDDKKYQGIGITSGLKETVSAIVFNYTEDGWCSGISIGKVDGKGEWVSRSTLDFNDNYHYAIKWTDVESNQFDRSYENNTEFYMVCDILESFAYNMPGSAAYATADFTRFDTSRAAGRLKPIYEKLGIEWGNTNNGGYNRGDGNNFFNNNTRGGTAEHKDFDDAMDELPFE